MPPQLTRLYPIYLRLKGRSMNVTELLVTGYDGDEPLFVVKLAPDEATTVRTIADEDGEATVDSVAQQATDVFASVRQLLEGLAPTATRA